MNGCAVGGTPAASSRADLVEQPLAELRVHSARDPFGRRFGRDLQREGSDVVLGQRRLRVGEMLGERTSGQVIHLQRAHEALQIARLYPLRGRRVNPREQAMEPLRALAVRRSPPAGHAERCRAPVPEKTASQRTVIEPRAAHENRQPSAAA